MSEADICVGDVFRAGTATVQVSQGRQPCWKLNVRFGVSDMAIRVQQTGRTGWYYRVLDPGTVKPGEMLRLIDRPQPDWSIARISEVLYRRKCACDELDALSQVPELACGWLTLAKKRVESRRVEDWSERLQGRG